MDVFFIRGGFAPNASLVFNASPVVIEIENVAFVDFISVGITAGKLREGLGFDLRKSETFGDVNVIAVDEDAAENGIAVESFSAEFDRSVQFIISKLD